MQKKKKKWITPCLIALVGGNLRKGCCHFVKRAGGNMEILNRTILLVRRRKAVLLPVLARPGPNSFALGNFGFCPPWLRLNEDYRYNE